MFCIGGNSIKASSHFARTYFTDDSLVEATKRFWQVKEMGHRDKAIRTPEDNRIMEETKSSMFKRDGHYSVAIAWKAGVKEQLENNYEMALKKLENTESKLKKNPEIATSYTDTIQEYQEKGYIRKLTKGDCKESEYDIQHFPVVRMDKATTKTWIVFDASAKDRNHVSLNNAMYQGPKLQKDLFEVLMGFHSKPITLASDISEMYLQIKMHEPDRKYHRFLWPGSRSVKGARLL